MSKIELKATSLKSLLALSAVLTGCVGYVGGGYADVVVPVPGVVVFGGDYDRGPDTRGYSRRGEESRGHR